ncbi:MAG: UDP-glucose/GDP-mannose dehydrogenase family protein [Verrucomicrobia bacterium]|nr:UDP-glucose/GDP-mannose dehydrogenase family protein [Verrucomicrobiota bacterium]
MKISIFGLGYVGVVTSACLVRDGFEVIGVDVNAAKVGMIQRGETPIIEPGLSDLLRAGAESGALSATVSADDAVAKSDISLVCVGTPSRPDGGLDDSHVRNVCEEIGAAIAAKGREHVVVIRSTVLPGTTDICAGILAGQCGEQKAHVAFNPEFLREGSAIRDYDAPPYTVVGTRDSIAENAVRAVYAPINAPVIVTPTRVAEMIKYTANAWHATKITFANEIGRIAKAVDVDGRDVMAIISQDDKLNTSSAYMKPGFAYGGSCLPKDVRAMTHFSRMNHIPVPLLDSLAVSNKAQIEIALERIMSSGKKRIGMLGLAFKPATDDLRESPAVELAERLLGKGYDVRILDGSVHEARLIGANKQYIEEKIAHLSSLMTADAAELMSHAELLVICNGSPEFREMVAENAVPDVPVLDLVGLFKSPPESVDYDGIAW